MDDGEGFGLDPDPAGAPRALLHPALPLSDDCPVCPRLRPLPAPGRGPSAYARGAGASGLLRVCTHPGPRQDAQGLLPDAPGL
jgi:hypothetical protein